MNAIKSSKISVCKSNIHFLRYCLIILIILVDFAASLQRLPGLRVRLAVCKTLASRRIEYKNALTVVQPAVITARRSQRRNHWSSGSRCRSQRAPSATPLRPGL